MSLTGKRSTEVLFMAGNAFVNLVNFPHLIFNLHQHYNATYLYVALSAPVVELSLST